VLRFTIIAGKRYCYQCSVLQTTLVNTDSIEAELLVMRQVGAMCHVRHWFLSINFSVMPMKSSTVVKSSNVNVKALALSKQAISFFCRISE
jgi:hypothetical protein